jgi:hypothetical protein
VTAKSIRPNGNIAGVVRDNFGAGIQNVEIRIHHDGEFIRGIRSAERGEYQIQDLEPGQYVLHFKHHELLPLSREVTVRSARNSFCNIRLNAAQSLLRPRISLPQKIIKQSPFMQANRRPVPVSGAYAAPYVAPQEQDSKQEQTKTHSATGKDKQ